MVCSRNLEGRSSVGSHMGPRGGLLFVCLAACGPSAPTEAGPSAAPNASAAPRAESPDDVVEVGVGPRHSCLRTRAGSVECWGWNDYGQLGDGSLVPHFRPAPVRDLTDAVDIAVFVDGTCAARRDGSVWCWGRHASWDSSQPWENEQKVPVEISGLTDAVEVYLTWQSVVAVTKSKEARTYPGGTRLGPVHDVAVGPSATCWLTPERATFCRGENVGSGFPAEGVEISAIRTERAEEIFMLGDGACVLTATKQPICFSRRATDGVIDVERPQVADVRAFGSTHSRACAATGDGRLTCFRAGTDRTVTVVEGAGDVTSLALDERVGCVTRADGTAHCWGDGRWGQLGDGSAAKADTPILVPGLPPIIEIASTNSEHFALAEDGRLFHWGIPWSPSDGAGKAVGPAVEVVPSVKHVSASPHLACVTLQSGSVHCRRDAEDAKPGATFDRWTEIPSLAGAREILGVEVSFQKLDGEARASDDLVYAIDANEDLWVFRSGALPGAPPVKVDGVRGVKSLGVATDHACAVVSGGRAVCWHHKFLAEVGLDEGRASPYLVRPSFRDMERAEGACLLRAGGKAECHGISVDGLKLIASDSHGGTRWQRELFGAHCMGHGNGSFSCGYGSMSQLGSQPLDGATDVTLATDAACVLRGDHTVACWGDNAHSRLGIAGTWTADRPVPVVRAARP